MSLSMFASEGKINLARQLHEPIIAARERIEDEQKLPEDLLDQMVETGIFRALMPGHCGGEEWDLPVFCRFVEEVSKSDGSVGWTAGPGPGSGGIFTGWLPDDTIRQICSSPRGGMIAGAGAPFGKARRENGQVVLIGRWPFGSGVCYADWALCGFHYDDEKPRLGRVAIVPRDQVKILDTWHVGGMKGSASDDYEVHEIRVDPGFIMDLDDEPQQSNPHFRLSTSYVFGACLAPLALGIARGSVDAFVDILRAKIDIFSGNPMSERQTVSERLARAEASLRSARAFFYQTADEIWNIAQSGRSPNEREEAIAGLSVRHAVDASVQVVDTVYHAAGTSAIFINNPLERHFRDIHVTRQHRFASPEEMHLLGASLLQRD